MKAILAIFAIMIAFAQIPSLAHAQNDAYSGIGTNRDEECYPDPWEPAFTCFANDVYNRAQGVASSFTSQQAASQRAIASCQRKSQRPQTCHITRCRQPEVHCHDHNGNGNH